MPIRKDETPWLDLAKAEMGTKEAPGDADNPVVLAYYAEAGHGEIEHDAVAWCSAFVGAMLARAGYPNTGSLAARSYATYGVGLKTPSEGCIVVMKRGNSSWEGHVGFYVGDAGARVKVLGGNQGDAVSIATFPKSSVIAYRMPVAPTVKALREAGSTEVASADTMQKIAVAGSGVAAAAGAAQQTTAATIPAVDTSLKNLADHVTILQKLQAGADAILNLAQQHLWVVLLALGIAAFLYARYLKQQRVAKHQSGIPLSQQVG